MTNRFFVFGDSWPNGDELTYPVDAGGGKTFGNLVAARLCYEFFNYSESSTSVPHLILQLQQAVKVDNCGENDTALFFLTSPSRDLVLHNNNGKCTPGELHPHNPQCSWWYKKGHSKYMEEFRTNTTILSLLSMCEYYQISPKFVWGWDKTNLWPEIDSSVFYHKSCAEMFDKNYTNFIDLRQNSIYFTSTASHPNQLGHECIAENLTKWLQNS